MKNSLIHKVLELARWSPSGDNTQPWKFEIINQYEAVIHTKDTREHVVYDINGRPTQIAIGALLQTIEFAASRYKCIAQIQNLFDEKINSIDLQFKITLIENEYVKESELCKYIQIRTVNRRNLAMNKLSIEDKNKLQQSVGEHFKIRWYDSFTEKKNIALMIAKTTDLRLSIPKIKIAPSLCKQIANPLR